MQQAKVISESAIIGQLGVTIVERTLLDMELLFHTTGQVEAGIDEFVELRDSMAGRVSNFIIIVQVKATQQEFPKETPTSFEWPCSKRDLEYWLQGNAPVVLIVVRPRTNEAYCDLPPKILPPYRTAPVVGRVFRTRRPSLALKVCKPRRPKAAPMAIVPYLKGLEYIL
jgi:Domain of unknown function (DUF4365)